jgi:hypothetical protein
MAERDREAFAALSRTAIAFFIPSPFAAPDLKRYEI